MAVVFSGMATTDGATIITIPAGKTWRGSITVSASLAAQPSLGATTVIPTVTIHGTNSDPDDGSVLAAVAVSTPPVNLLSLLGVSSTNTVNQSGVTLKAPASNSVTLQLNTTSPAVTVAVANGITSTT